MLTQNPNSSQATDWEPQGVGFILGLDSNPTRLSACLIGVFLVSVPVFFQAPLVRFFPWIGLLLTACWLSLGLVLMHYWKRPLLGDLVLGFSWSWLAGAIYWGWLREEPFLHLPVEAIGLPFALLALWQGSFLVGHCFYLGSLFGTVITDFYFYALDLIPFWRRVMHVSLDESIPILHEASQRVMTLEGGLWAVLLVLPLLLASSKAFRSSRLHWWVFSGAVIGTLLVDALFGLSAVL